MFKYQQLVNEGSAIFEERCLTIDPLVEKHIDVGEKWLSTHQAFGSAEIILSYSDEYNKTTEEIVEKSVLWLDKSKAFLNRWDFQYFTHPALKDVFSALFNKYHADYQANVAYLTYANDPTNQKLYDRYFEAVKNMYAQQEILDNQINNAQQHFDIRSYFTKVPKLRCGAVNDNPGISVIIKGLIG